MGAAQGMKSLEQRVAEVLAGKNVCPRCGDEGTDRQLHMVKKDGIRHCMNVYCDVRYYRHGFVVSSGYLTNETREGPGT